MVYSHETAILFSRSSITSATEDRLNRSFPRAKRRAQVALPWVDGVIDP
jgi:hypothetical protein